MIILFMDLLPWLQSVWHFQIFVFSRPDQGNTKLFGDARSLIQMWASKEQMDEVEF